MKEKNIFITFLSLITISLFVSCSSEKVPEGDPYLNFEGNIQVLNVGKDGISKDDRRGVVIRSNRDWKISLSQADSTWIHVFVDEGKDDGIFYFWVDENDDFETRTGRINVISDGIKDKGIEINQESNQPYITIVNAENGYTALPAKGHLKIPVEGNIEWVAALEQNDWAVIDSLSEDTVYVSVSKNTGGNRKVKLVVAGKGDFKDHVSTTIISQSAPGILLYERFDWLQEGKEDFYYAYPEVKFSKWNDTEKGHGWTSIGGYLYGGRGYIKLGKTKMAGDAVSPPLTVLKKPTDVEISFKCIGYMAGNGKKDDGVLSVGIIGPGEIESEHANSIEIESNSYKVASFDITVYPDSPKKEHGEGYNPWIEPAATFKFHIKGAAKETRLVFVGGAKWGKQLQNVGQGKNRVLIDDIKVVEE